MNRASPTAAPEAVVSKEAYSKAVDCAQLRDIRLTTSNFQANAEAFLPASKSWKRAYACDISDTFYDAEAKLLTGWVTGEVYVKVSRKKIFDLKVKYLLVYDVEGEPEAPAAEHLVRTIGAFAVYPYLRSHFSECVAQAGLRFPPLPVLKQGKHRIKSVSGEDEVTRE